MRIIGNNWAQLAREYLRKRHDDHPAEGPGPARPRGVGNGEADRHAAEYWRQIEEGRKRERAEDVEC